MQQENHYFLPKDSFLEVVLEIAKERYFFEYCRTKSELFIKETIDGTMDGYVMETIGSMEEEMLKVKAMDYQEFLIYLLNEYKGNYNLNGTLPPSFSNLIDSILPPIKVFVDRG